MEAPIRIMTVCTGNICRSPMAEIVLREALGRAGIGAEAVLVDSTGVSSEEHGNPIDPRAHRVLAAHGYPSGSGHRARKVTAEQLVERDLVLAMTARHARILRQMLAHAGIEDVGFDGGARVRMMREFDPEAPAVGLGESEEPLNVDDPWYGGMEGFVVCLDELEQAIAGVVEAVRLSVS